jgi:HK97 family phage portal protein
MSVRTRFSLMLRAVTGRYNEDSARAAFGLLSGIYPAATGALPVRGTAEQLDAYNSMPWLRAPVDRIGYLVGSTCWELYATKRTPGTGRQAKFYRAQHIQRAMESVTRKRLMADRRNQGELVEIDTHPLLDLLDRPNPFHTGLDLMKLVQTYQDLVGETYLVKQRDGLGVLSALYPVPAHWVISTPTPSNPTFRVSWRGWQGQIPETEMLWIKHPDPTDPYGRGSGLGKTLSDELDTDEYAAKHVRSFFYNGARPDFMAWPKGNEPAKDSEVRRLEQDWTNKNQGFWRAFKPYFLTREMGVYEFEKDFSKLQMKELREFQRDLIINVFGMSPEALGVSIGADRAHAEAAEYQLTKNVVLPRQEFLRATLQERLVPEYDERLILDFVSPVQDDKQAQLEAAKVAPYSLMVDEWRGLAGQQPLEDEAGQVHVLPINVQLVRNIGDETDLQEAQAETPVEVPPPDVPVNPVPVPVPAVVPPEETPEGKFFTHKFGLLKTGLDALGMLVSHRKPDTVMVNVAPPVVNVAPPDTSELAKHIETEIAKQVEVEAETQGDNLEAWQDVATRLAAIEKAQAEAQAVVQEPDPVKQPEPAPAVPVERVTTVERDSRGLIIRMRSIDTPLDGQPQRERVTTVERDQTGRIARTASVERQLDQEGAA